ncbi:hypothetical protein VTJ04DRAFT_3057 [Mycothermus thermophilus]|uniref:uncharacterized protein n=1 Tax=Humicola insolens TaxID=85995 RepID=UPI0037426CAE
MSCQNLLRLLILNGFSCHPYQKGSHSLQVPATAASLTRTPSQQTKKRITEIPLPNPINTTHPKRYKKKILCQRPRPHVSLVTPPRHRSIRRIHRHRRQPEPAVVNYQTSCSVLERTEEH